MIADIVLDHVAVAVERHPDAWPRYRRDLGGEWMSAGDGFGFSPAQLAYADGMRIEILQPHAVERNDFLRRFLDRNGPGPHHLTFKVGDIQAAIDEVTAAGYPPVSIDLSDPGWQEAFLHPKAASGVVVQLAQAEGSWVTDPPADLPPPDRPTGRLVHVAHAVASLDAGLDLWAAVLGGVEDGRGEDGDARWVDLQWRGPGRVRLLTPTRPDSPVAAWLDGRPGRIHHLAFAVERPEAIADARPTGDGIWEVDPADNLGTRLVLRSP